MLSQQLQTMAVVADLDLAYTVLLPGRMILSPSDVHYQIAHAGDFNCEGLNTFTIAFMIVVTVAVCLRLWSRRIESIEWRSDDYTLIAGLVRLHFLPHCLQFVRVYPTCNRELEIIEAENDRSGNVTNHIFCCLDSIIRRTGLLSESHI